MNRGPWFVVQNLVKLSSFCWSVKPGEHAPVIPLIPRALMAEKWNQTPFLKSQLWQTMVATILTYSGVITSWNNHKPNALYGSNMFVIALWHSVIWYRTRIKHRCGMSVKTLHMHQISTELEDDLLRWRCGVICKYRAIWIKWLFTIWM